MAGLPPFISFSTSYLELNSAVASAPAAFRVRVWEIMSRGQGLGARRTPPESASVGYSLSQKWLRQGRCRVHDADRTRKRATGAEVLGAQQLGACTRHGQAVESPVTVEARVGDAAHAQRCRRRRET